MIRSNQTTTPKKTPRPRRTKNWPVLVCLSVALLAASPRIVQLFGTSEAVASLSAHLPQSSTPDQSPRLITKPIEQIRCGDRIPSELPDGLLPEDEPEPDPATWRLVELEVEKADGGKVEIKLLRPVTWFEQVGATTNGAITNGRFPLNVGELDIDGDAAVVKILPCPPIQPGEGQVVTGTFRHVCDSLVALSIDGESAPIVCTTGHPIWSDDRQEFVAAATLAEGESLRTATGRLTSLVATQRSSAQRAVFNLEVSQSHVYFVGQTGTLVHNMCSETDDDAPKGRMTPDQQALKELVDETSLGGRKPLTVDQADTVLDWADEVGYPEVRVKPGDVGNPSNWPGGGGQPHIHVPGVGSGYIPVQPGVRPR